MRFSAGEAAFEGFRVTRHHPAALAAWVGVCILTLIAMAATATPVLAPAFDEFRASVISGGAPSLELQARLLQAMVVVVPLNLVSQAILLPALYRAMASDGADRFGFLRLGRDELRVLGVLAILLFISIVLGQAGALLHGLVSMVGLGIVGGAIEVAIMLLSIYVSVRLVLQAPASYATGSIDIAASWRSTKGLFWPLLGLAIMAGVMAIVVALLLSIVALPLSELAGGFTEVSPVTVAAGFGLLIVGATAMAMSATIVSAPFMAVYRELSSDAKA
ncbi:hypothetical protein BH09PSE1_BH09PSE1_10690 [soil metagenome]